MRKKLLRWLALMVVPVVFTSCQLIPEEEVLPEIPVVKSYKTQSYETSLVMRGDLEITEKVSCRYVAAKEENLSFALGGLYIDTVYANEGQDVKAGDLLAELVQDDLKTQVENLEYELAVLKLKKQHILQDRELDLKKQDVVLKELEWELENTEPHSNASILAKVEKKRLERENVDAGYAEQMQAIEDSIYIQEIKLQEMQKNLQNRQIRAGFDGTVTYVREVSDGQRSVTGQNFVTISDMDSTVFCVEGEKAQYFPVGTEVVITCSKKEFTAVSVEPSELGLEEAQEGEEAIAYLRLKQPDPSLEDGVRGNIILVMEQSKDTLYVAKDAVKTANGEPIVYTVDDSGLRVMQNVKTGLDNGNYVEITEGLEEGDLVIIY